MLIEFNVENYKSFKNRATLNLVSTSIKELRDEAIIDLERVNLLKGVVLYGSNGSGKSNLLNALVEMKWLVLHSSKESQAEETLEVEPFLLDETSNKAPSIFEVVFLVKDKKYRYGFEATPERITGEWLFETRKIKENPLFIRDHDEIQLVDRFIEGEGLELKTRSNALFLSVVAQFNGKISKKILSWFKQLNLVHGIRDEQYFDVTAKMLEKEDTREIVLDFMKYADLGITDMKLQEIDRDIFRLDEMLNKKFQKAYKEIIDEYKSQKFADIITYHNKYNSSGKIIGQVEFSLAEQESKGTSKFFNIIGAVIASLLMGAILIIDEMNARLHPLLTWKIVQTFNSKKGNPKGAQLIFTTHDTNLLNKSLLRRDQIYFTEKNQFGASFLYSLAEYKARNDEAYEKNYISGKYGAIPFVNNFEELIEKFSN